MLPKRHLPSQTGFTIIELIMVIVLIGILSVGARSLFFSRDSYAGFLARDQLVSAALLAQQQALGMSAVTDPVTLVVANTGTDWTFTVTKSGGVRSYLFTQESGASTLTVDGTALASGASQTFTWDGQGNMSNNTGHVFLFAGEYSWRACLSASGYAWASDGVCP